MYAPVELLLLYALLPVAAAELLMGDELVAAIGDEVVELLPVEEEDEGVAVEEDCADTDNKPNIAMASSTTRAAVITRMTETIEPLVVERVWAMCEVQGLERRIGCEASSTSCLAALSSVAQRANGHEQRPSGGGVRVGWQLEGVAVVQYGGGRADRN